jgi:hypothetical protein
MMKCHRLRRLRRIWKYGNDTSTSLVKEKATVPRHREHGWQRLRRIWKCGNVEIKKSHRFHRLHRLRRIWKCGNDTSTS